MILIVYIESEIVFDRIRVQTFNIYTSLASTAPFIFMKLGISIQKTSINVTINPSSSTFPSPLVFPGLTTAAHPSPAYPLFQCQLLPPSITPSPFSFSLLPSFKYPLIRHTSKSPVSTSTLLPSPTTIMAPISYSENDVGVKPQTRRVCVMDASGHLGTNLVKRLLDVGFAVHAAVHSHGWLLAEFQYI